MDSKKPGIAPYHLVRRILLVMADMDFEKRPLGAVAIVGTWLTLTLFHDACAIQAEGMIDVLIEMKKNTMIPLVMSLVEVTLCASIITVASGKFASYMESVCIAMFAHLFGTFLVYTVAQDTDPAHGLMGTLVEPLVCLLLLYICKGFLTNITRTVSLVLISCGLVFASLNFRTIRETDRRFVVRVLCGVFYVLRNIVISHWHEESVPVDRRNSKAFMVIGSVVLCAFAMLSFSLPMQFLVPVGFALFTCCIHVYLTFITSAVLLTKLSVPTVCLMTVCVQCLESQILMTSSHRPGVLVAAVACVFLVMGVYLYAVDAVETGHTFHALKVSTNEMLTRIQFLMFASCIMGVLFYVLQPRVSSRDLNNLSMVGLDKVIRRLLSIEQPEGHEH